jgi:CRISPR-associated endonuclease Cas1
MTTIYVAQPQTELKIHSRQLQIFQQQKFCFAVPLHRVNQIIILGQQAWTRKAVSLALSLNIPVLYFEPNGQCVEYASPADSAKYLRNQMQRSSCADFTRSTAESIVRAKLHNAQALLLHLRRDRGHPIIEQVLNLLHRLADDLPLVPTLADLQAYENTGSAFYHAGLNRLLPDEYRLQNLGINPLQRLFNLGTALLSQRIQIVLQTLGLDLDIANLHLDALHRPPLVCDFLSELHIPIVDRLVMQLLLHQQILPDDFIGFDRGIFLRPAALEIFIHAWDDHLSAPVEHPYLGEIPCDRCLEIQAQEYIACLLEDQSFYRPMLLKQ